LAFTFLVTSPDISSGWRTSPPFKHVVFAHYTMNPFKADLSKKFITFKVDQIFLRVSTIWRMLNPSGISDPSKKVTPTDPMVV